MSDLPRPPGIQPAPARSARSRWVRRHFVRAAGNRVLASDVVRVTLMAVAITLSSFAVYQATRAADDAGERLDELRIAQAADTRWSSYLATIVDHDARTMMLFCTTTAERDGAMAGLLQEDPRPSLIVSSTLRARALRSMVLGDPLARCPAAGGGPAATPSYEVERARQLLLGSTAIAQSFSGRAASGGLALDVARLGAAERNLMAAGLLLAISLGCLIFVEVSGQRGNRPGWLRGRAAGRWRRLGLLVAAVSGLAGLGLLLANVVDPLPTAILLGAIVAAVAGIPMWLRRRRRSGLARTLRADPHWWAETLGAVALVAFSLAACGLSAAAIHHREVVAHADALLGESQRLQQVAEQEALRDLASMSLMAELEAEQSAASDARVRAGKDKSAEFDRLKEVETALNEQAKSLEQAVREQSHRTPGGECPDLVGTEAASAGDLFYNQLGSGDAPVLRTSVLRWHVLERQQSAIACDVATALTRSTARVWAGHTSTFTVALVILGLAGFMLALASDSDRSRGSSRVLLAIGTGGIILGLLLGSTTLPDLVWRSSIPSGDAIREGATAIASSYVDECGADARAALNRAIELHAGYGPAWAQRGRAGYCDSGTYGEGYLSSEVNPDVLPAIIADLKKAAIAGPPSPHTLGSLGWALISRGLDTGRAPEVVDGVWRTSLAVSSLEQANDSSGTLLPIARLNRALGLAALGNRELALEAYQRAVHCLEPGSACPGGGLADPAQVDDMILGALADLELIAAREDVEPYRLALMAGRASSTDVDVAELELSLFDQELQMSKAKGSPVVWYFKSAAARTWAVIDAPSRVTARPDWSGPLVPAGRVLEAGDYRADVYTGGRRVELPGKKTSAAAVGRFFSRRLGLSVAAPSGWETRWDDGAEWHSGPSDADGLTLRRMEGVAPMGDTEDYLRAQLAAWLKDHANGARLTTTVKPDEVWFLGYTDTLVAEVPGLLVAAHLEPYGNRSECGGTLFLAAITGDAAKARDLVEEVVLEVPQQPPTDRPVTLKPGGHFTIELPARWGAELGHASDEYALSGGSCETDADVQVDWPKLPGTLDKAVEADLDELAATGTRLSVESEAVVTVKGARSARLVTYTKVTAAGDSIVGWQLSAEDDDRTRLFVDVDAPLAERAEVEAQVKAMLDSVELT